MTSPLPDSGLPSYVGPLLLSIAAEILCQTPTQVTRGRFTFGAVTRDYVRFSVPGQASVELCAHCGQRAWLTTCGCAEGSAS